MVDNDKFFVYSRNSAGYVYLKFENIEGASRAQQAMHKRWFARRLISAIFLVKFIHSQWDILLFFSLKFLFFFSFLDFLFLKGSKVCLSWYFFSMGDG